MERRSFLASATAAAITTLPRWAAGAGTAVRIGLLLPLTGTDAARGRMVRDGALLAVDEINARAGRHGRFIAALVEDSRSDPALFRAGLRRLAGREKVASVFGLCPPSDQVGLPHMAETLETLFWDPAASAGGLCTKHVVHGGPTPYQSLKHLVPWTVARIGGRVLLVGGADSHGRELLRVCRMMLPQVGGGAVGADILVTTAETDLIQVIDRVRAGGVDAVLSALSGGQAVALLRQVKAAGIDSRATPVVSPTLTEVEVAAAGAGVAAGAVAAQPWFSSWVSPAGWRFMDRMRRRHGGAVVATALAEAAWTQIHLFGSALDQLGRGDVHPLNIREAAKDRIVEAPQGRVRIDGQSLYATLWPKIAVVEPSGRFRILARAGREVPPLPFWAFPRQACADTGLRHFLKESQGNRRNSRRQ